MYVKQPVSGQFVIRGRQSKMRRWKWGIFHALSLSVAHPLFVFSTLVFHELLLPFQTSVPSLSLSITVYLSIEVRSDTVGMWSKGKRCMYGGIIIGSVQLLVRFSRAAQANSIYFLVLNEQHACIYSWATSSASVLVPVQGRDSIWRWCKNVWPCQTNPVI